METKLLNPWALDGKGNFVSIEHARKDQDYFCPNCHAMLHRPVNGKLMSIQQLRAILKK